MVDTSKPHIVTESNGSKTHYLGDVHFKISPESKVGNPPPKTEGK